ncbi:hypothetical protein F3Y22_tig00110123pilonHSYRG00036 [Hibiscus syriacus]|uniref:Uncharacterized protein n=1 Tax=Hibiscus syriacus TaxID=106335 RepID=A0A6A3BI97_HIBSY|nr:hypothetical protein F3Y22_tig00110123pilonHSYRG00036 [Hibiscus syriacus]
MATTYPNEPLLPVVMTRNQRVHTPRNMGAPMQSPECPRLAQTRSPQQPWLTCEQCWHRCLQVTPPKNSLSKSAWSLSHGSGLWLLRWETTQLRAAQESSYAAGIGCSGVFLKFTDTAITLASATKALSKLLNCEVNGDDVQKIPPWK